MREEEDVDGTSSRWRANSLNIVSCEQIEYKLPVASRGGCGGAGRTG